MLRHICIEGLRGFANAQVLQPAMPNNKPGSGLTSLVGPNNSGKSTIIEALSSRRPNGASFNVGMRNSKQDAVRLFFRFDSHKEFIRSLARGKSETVTKNLDPGRGRIYIVPSRRHFQPYFSKSNGGSRSSHMNTMGHYLEVRAPVMTSFEARLFQIERDSASFNALMREVVPEVLSWSIDQSENSQYFLKFYSDNHSHSSMGIGDGIVSVFVILSAIYDSEPGETIVIDEPELSLHPQVQRRLCRILEEKSADRQIVISTHSPYFASRLSLINGGKIVRVWNRNEAVEIFSADVSMDCGLQTLLSSDANKPHMFGLDAKEIFFVDDGVLVFEGQEDVVFWPMVVGHEFAGQYSTYGWGAGGISNVEAVLKLLKCLGFKKVAAVVDNDVPAELSELKLKFPDYFVEAIPAADIRTKKAVKARDRKIGLLDDSNSAVRPEHAGAIVTLKERIDEHMNDPDAA